MDNPTLRAGIALAAIPVLKDILLAVAGTGANVGRVIAALDRIPNRDADERLDDLAESVRQGDYSVP